MSTFFTLFEFDTAQNGKWFPWVPCSASLHGHSIVCVYRVPLVIFCCVWNELRKSRRNKNLMIVVLVDRRRNIQVKNVGLKKLEKYFHNRQLYFYYYYLFDILIYFYDFFYIRRIYVWY